jgi:formate hydrogenlyase subunit 3/multisubunit Na+/H+ antiporter MnhD subunit
VTLLLAGAAVALATASGLPGVLLRRSPARGQLASCVVLCAAAALGVAAAAATLAGHPAGVVNFPWSAPGAALALRLDALSALFLMPILAVPAVCSVYGLAYWPQQRLGPKAIRLQLAFGLAAGSMALVVLAANGILFLAAWEVMAVAGFLLVLTEHEKEDAQRAAFLYLIAAHVGVFALFAFFSIAAAQAGSFDFASWHGLPAAGPFGTWCFALMLAGFGMKAGFLPLHFWLPPAHAAAPSHVSAILSGVLLKTGIYGVLRFTGFFDAPPASWGALLLAAGTVSGVLGVAFALGQHDLKRLLAWHSVENIGIIGMGAGLALLGRARGDAALVVLGFSGAALHVVNHALFKSLLFLGAGCVQHACGTRELDRLGGLARAMPITAGLFLLGAAAISGLPPLNGFASEWLVGLGALRTLQLDATDLVTFAALSLPALALIGGLAAACFVKVHGAVFLGTARTAEATRAHEPPRTMLAPMGALALACAAIGLFPQLWVGPLARAAASWSGFPEAQLAAAAAPAAAGAAKISAAAGILLAVALAAALARRRRMAGAPAPLADTWGCGFTAPSSRMQYTASSFAQMLVQRFSWALRPHGVVQPPRGVFPRRASFEAHVPDVILDGLLLPATRLAERVAALLRPLFFQPRIHLHVLFLLSTLLIVLAWRFLGRTP